MDFVHKEINPGGPRRFTVISTFAGCGGSSLGYKWAGGRVLAAVEWDANAVATYERNHKDTRVIHADIADVTAAELLRIGGLAPGELDLFDGSPPCQGFSTAGKRRIDDPRNSLFREYVRLLDGLKPRAFVMENVPGLIQGPMRWVFARIIESLKGCGYEVRAWVIDARYFGVPQGRKRLIFIGYRADLAARLGIVPTCPKPQTRPIAAGTALRGLVIDQAERAMLLEAGRTRAAYQDWHLIRPGGKRIDLDRTSGFSCRKYHPLRPAYTVTKNEGVLTLHGAMHWAERRRFTTGEFKRFASFPDAFQFEGDWSDAVQRIGNSVPPRLMQAIAEHVYEMFLSRVHALDASNGVSTP